MTIHLATDHAGLMHKEALKAALIAKGYEVVDHGAVFSDAEDDYPDFITPCAQAVASDRESFGIIFGGSGQGEAMCANRAAGIRAAVYYGGKPEIITLAREHNDANMLSMGARFVSLDEAVVAALTFIETAFSNDARHVRRIAKF